MFFQRASIESRIDKPHAQLDFVHVGKANIAQGIAAKSGRAET